jgi:DNA-3-methyladenine glycosylase
MRRLWLDGRRRPRGWSCLRRFSPMIFDADFFARDVQIVARELIGVVMLVNGSGGRIVETEAYAPNDPASHSFVGPTPRNAVMFGPPRRAYVYRIYGIHHCLNFTTGAGSAVLIRAIEPTAGIEHMVERRGATDLRRLCAGPGMLCQALDVDRRLDGAPLDAPPFHLSAAAVPLSVTVGPRIGISKGAEMPWRFGLAGSRFLSRPFGPQQPKLPQKHNDT